MEKHIKGENGLNYTLGEDGLYYPDLILSEETNYPIGKYGRMRQAFLKEHRKATHTNLLINGKLNQHLHDIDEECYQRLEILMEQMKEREGITEQLKAENQMLWVGKMNNIKACAEEILFTEIIYN